MEIPDTDLVDPCELGICNYQHYDCRKNTDPDGTPKDVDQVVTLVFSGIENYRYRLKMGTPPDAKAERLIEFYCRIMHVDRTDYIFKVKGKIFNPEDTIASLQMGPGDLMVGYKK